MLTPIENLPRGAIGFVANGRITSDDRQDIFEPTIDRALRTQDRVKLLYVAGRDFTGYEHDAAFDETVFGSRHFQHFEKIAFVADEGPHNRAVVAMKGLVPAIVKVFGRNELAEAREWLAV